MASSEKGEAGGLTRMRLVTAATVATGTPVERTPDSVDPPHLAASRVVVRAEIPVGPLSVGGVID
jgi:hypothetical protein